MEVNIRGFVTRIIFCHRPLKRWTKGQIGEARVNFKTNKAIIRVASSVSDKKLMEVLIHESLHICYWDLDEQAIGEGGRDISKILWRAGYRRVPD